MDFEVNAIRKMKETHTITIDEGERQAILLALAHTTVERPGWEYMYTEIAKKMDNVVGGVPEMYTQFLALRRRRVSNSLPDEPTSTSLNKALGCTDFNAGASTVRPTENTGSLNPVEELKENNEDTKIGTVA